jgi:hypothetical protein
MKRAQFFLTVGGVYAAKVQVKEKMIRTRLLEKKVSTETQLKLFEPQNSLLTGEDVYQTLTGNM